MGAPVFLRRSVEMDFRDFLLLGEEVELTELVDILFLLFPNSSVMNSAICCYGDLGYQKKLPTAPVSVFSPPLLVPVLWGGRFGTFYQSVSYMKHLLASRGSVEDSVEEFEHFLKIFALVSIFNNSMCTISMKTAKAEFHL